MTSTNGRRDEGRISGEDFAYLQQLMRRRTGIVLEAGKEYLAEARLSALAQREGFGSATALLEGLHTEEDSGLLHRRVVEALAITETSFFRDLHPFESLRRQLLPELIEKRAPERALQVWCAACSSGQEPFSLAMLIREHFPQLLSWKLQLIASDLSLGMLERARAGLYSKIEVNRGLPAALLVKCFAESGTEWKLRDEVRRMVEFREINLVTPWPTLPPMDVIMMRNVLLYFDAETRRSVLKTVSRALKPDGYLILGGGETTLMLDDSFEPVQMGRTVCYRPSVSYRSALRRAG